MMANLPSCDICEAEAAIQMLTNFADGSTLAIGAACSPMFFGQAALATMEAGEHKGPATRCQACRRMHERMTTPVAPMGDVSRETAEEIPGQMTVEEAAEPS